MKIRLETETCLGYPRSAAVYIYIRNYPYPCKAFLLGMCPYVCICFLIISYSCVLVFAAASEAVPSTASKAASATALLSPASEPPELPETVDL